MFLARTSIPRTGHIISWDENIRRAHVPFCDDGKNHTKAYNGACKTHELCIGEQVVVIQSFPATLTIAEIRRKFTVGREGRRRSVDTKTAAAIRTKRPLHAVHTSRSRD